MSWAARRRFLIVFLLGAVALSFAVVILIATFTKAPSCNDRSQNQGEAGIDCGGPCAYLCIEQVHSPTVLFTKAIPNGSGRTDVVASVENINAGAAAKGVPYTITLYGTGQLFVQEVSGTFDLPPLTKVPIFIPGIVSGNQKTIRAFLTIGTSTIEWYSMKNLGSARPSVGTVTLGGATSTPRIDAVISNDSVIPMPNVRVIVLVHSKEDEVIAASQTVLPLIPAQGSMIATYTWNTPFSATPARIEILPVVSLP